MRSTAVNYVLICHVLFCQFQCLRGLVVRSVSSNCHSPSNLASSKQLCVDEQIDSIVQPVLTDILQYQKQHNFTVYPAALSSIGALRYGGNAVRVNGKKHQLDHDIDLMLVGPPEAIIDEQNFQWHIFEQMNHLVAKGWSVLFGNGRSAFFNTVLNTRFSLKKLQDHKGREYKIITTYIMHQPNELERRAAQVEFRVAVDNAIEATSGTPWESHVEDISKVAKAINKPFSESDVIPPPGVSAPEVEYDFFARFGPQRLLRPHPTKKILFHGVTLQAPGDMRILGDLMAAAFWNFKTEAHQHASKFGICGFALPAKLEGFEDDVESTQDNIEVAQRCSSALQANGYESFSQCPCR